MDSDSGNGIGKHVLYLYFSQMNMRLNRMQVVESIRCRYIGKLVYGIKLVSLWSYLRFTGVLKKTNC